MKNILRYILIGLIGVLIGSSLLTSIMVPLYIRKGTPIILIDDVIDKDNTIAFYDDDNSTHSIIPLFGSSVISYGSTNRIGLQQWTMYFQIALIDIDCPLFFTNSTIVIQESYLPDTFLNGSKYNVNYVMEVYGYSYDVYGRTVLTVLFTNYLIESCSIYTRNNNTWAISVWLSDVKWLDNN